jgi:NTP pyrophosphatase (non-canonical NTP hydrolase)
VSTPKIEDEDDLPDSPTKVPTVSSAILGEFFDELAKDEAVGKVASELRKVVLDRGLFDESSIRVALFSDAP